MNLIKTLMLGSLILFAAAASAQNDDAKLKVVSNERDWTVYAYEGNPLECGIISRPKKTVNKRNGKVVQVKRGEFIILAVTLAPPGEKTKYLASFLGGYPFKKDSRVKADFGDKSFSFIIGETADRVEWAWPNPGEDDDLVESMMKGSTVTIVGVSQRGTETNDTFSLSGVTAGLEKAEAFCKKVSSSN